MKKIALISVIFAGLCGFAYLGDQGDKAPWFSIVPPLLAVTLAFLTHRVIFSIGVSIIVGGLLTAVPNNFFDISNYISGFNTGFGFVLSSASDPTNMQILCFVVLIMMMISVMITSGGLKALVEKLVSYAKTRRMTKLVTVFSGLSIFFDDYANSMIVGSAMKHATDKQRISREKLAFLVDATSAPIAGLAVISTWIGYEVGLFSDISKSLNFAQDGYAMFFDTIPFRFYCWMMIIFVFLNVIFDVEFGPMAKAENRALKTGKVKADDAVMMTSKGFSSTEPHEGAVLSMWSAILPLVLLIGFLIGGFWVDGGGSTNYGFAGLFQFEAWRITLASADNSIYILALGGGFGALTAILSALFIAKIPIQAILNSIVSGVKAGVTPVVILIFAWSLKGSCDALNTGDFLAGSLGDQMPRMLFPALLFLVSGVTAFGTGTSWGTMAILIPTAVPVAYMLDGNSYGIITIMCLGAVLDGSIFGDHCSPLSDTTLLSSIGSDCDHMAHVKTQLPYAITVAFTALVAGYLPAAAGLNPIYSLFGAGVIFSGIFIFFKTRARRS